MLGLMQLIVTPHPGLPAAGIILPGNCKPVSGSITLGVTPLEFFDSKKFPCRSRAVGTVTVTGSVGVIVCGFSKEKKKNALFLIRLGPPSPKRGSGNGPPILKPGILWRKMSLIKLALLLEKVLALADTY